MVSLQRLIKKKTTILFDVLAIAFFKSTSLHISAFYMLYDENGEISSEKTSFPH